MKTTKLSIPPGMQDFAPPLCGQRSLLESKARGVFARWGYEEVDVPLLEYMDVFTGVVGGVPEEGVFKCCDQDGRLLALRPDWTLPVARLAAMRMRDEKTLRLGYSGKVVSFRADRDGDLRESSQMGVELMGVPGPEGDAEIIALAVTTLLECGLTDFQVDIGQVGFFKGIVAEAGLSEEDSEELRRFVEEKNMFSIELALQQAKVPQGFKNRMMELPALYGGEEILDKAMGMSHHPLSVAAVENLRRVMDILKDYGLEQYISIDLGLVHAIHYYSGVIFRGMVEQVGYPLLTGGRYDGLLSEFGHDMPATGFGIGLQTLMAALQKKGDLPKVSLLDKIVGYDEASRVQAIGYIQKCRQQGLRVEQFLGKRDELAAYAAKKGAGEALWLGEQGMMAEEKL